MGQKTALLMGGTGVAGSAVVRNLKHIHPDWKIVVLSHLPQPDLDLFADVDYVQADAFNTGAMRTKLRNYDITHMFYTAHVFKPNMDWLPANNVGLRFTREVTKFSAKIAPYFRYFAEDDFQKMFANMVGMADGGTNLKLFSSVMEVVMEHPLEHVCICTGGRYYGSVFMGPGLHDYVIPFREDFQRLSADSWYYQVEDHLAECGETGKGWTWSVCRPSTIIGYSENSPFNFGTSLAVYASLMKEMGRPLTFPGMMKAYNAQIDHSSAELLARQMIWTTGEPQAANEAFNCVNADRAKWFEVWHGIGRFFDMPIQIEENGMSTEAIAVEAEESGLWADMIKKYGLRDQPLRSLMPRNTIDSFMMIDWDQPYSIEKTRAAGFTETIDSTKMFCDMFQTLRDVKAIP